MPEVLIINAGEVEKLLDQDALVDALRHAFRDFSSGATSVPPRGAAFSPSGLLGTMPGFVPNAGLGAKLVSVFAGNHGTSIPSHQALICLFDPENGTPVAIMDGGYITAVRTATSAAIAAKLLAREDSTVIAILGAGVQGRSHLAAFQQLFVLDEIRITSRNPESALELARSADSARAVTTFEEAVRGADIICCCTDAGEPVIQRAWISPGAHVSSVGRGTELPPAVVVDASIFVEWRGAVTSLPPAGTEELQNLDPQSVTEIGEVLLGYRPGRTSADELTVYKSTGHAMEDLASASIVFRRAEESGTGTRIQI